MNAKFAELASGVDPDGSTAIHQQVAAGPSLHGRYQALVQSIECENAVSAWRAGDVDLWPLARQDLYLDLFRQAGGDTAPRQARFILRAIASLAVPWTNAWKSRHDLAHWLPRPHRADAIFLGDGVSLDRVEGAWSDRFGEPIAGALERQGRSCFVMQSGNLDRLPWTRPTYAANQIAVRGALTAALRAGPELTLPDHGAVMTLLQQAGISAPSLAIERLRRRAAVVDAQAGAFERILRRVRPSVAFVVGHYAGLGPAFALACRRQAILCVDVQHCPRDAWHRAYDWPEPPERGYSTLPGLFWSWTDADAQTVRRWSETVDKKWHAAIVGGQTQIAAMSDGDRERLWLDAVGRTGDWPPYEREILVTLQPIGGKRPAWEALAEQIRSAPAAWRWWIRRHPASTTGQDREYAPLLAMRQPGVVIGAAAQAPLPALLSHMSAQVSLASGASVEAAMFGVPAFFLDAEARDTFPTLIATGQAAMVDVASLVPAIARLPASRGHTAVTAPSIDATLNEVGRMARDYAELCRVSDRAQSA